MRKQQEFLVRTRKKKAKAKKDYPLLPELMNACIPFAVVFSKCVLGSDVFAIVLDADYLTCDLQGFDNPFKGGFRVAQLKKKDRMRFEDIKKNGEWVRIDLGNHGEAWELVARPFKIHYQETKKAKRLTLKPVLA